MLTTNTSLQNDNTYIPLILFAMLAFYMHNTLRDYHEKWCNVLDTRSEALESTVRKKEEQMTCITRSLKGEIRILKDRLEHCYIYLDQSDNMLIRLNTAFAQLVKDERNLNTKEADRLRKQLESGQLLGKSVKEIQHLSKMANEREGVWLNVSV